ncbi:putative RNA-binding Zn ribbon-like protein [Pararhizobium capsulatum DSM 1112]|uniref:RNA-binding Zn ribbon-like protein n=1 Tax=Pararhizobium capsulatum DSM 1112 TaxID=1121113 RepID=A0ABU0BNF9_9HYPH|nr:CGNR zinc finger domain-containing protein [Pararhizobium capsulatum]MDQ0319789.1 putative RNA-binding Zn ribbon-like protein [Pararhizobium capsulatum DSM 1112]
MTFSWTPHRFSGGALALDVANSVVLRFDPLRRIDRFADPVAMDSFAGAAAKFCGERSALGPIAPATPARRPHLLALREATDRYFRADIEGRGSNDLLADLLSAISASIRNQPHSGSGPVPLEAATAHSALRLTAATGENRMKICPNCQWLFIDRSRNRSRSWCDMAVCGNRTKASRHYQKRKEANA